MASRTVVVASPQSNVAKKITDFSGSTWGELKKHAVVSSLLTSNVEAILNPGNVTLTRDDAELPTGDFRIFLVPLRNKAGMTSSEAADLGKQISDAIKEAASIASTDEVEALKSQLIETIEDFFGVDLDNCEECAEALEESRNYVK